MEKIKMTTPLVEMDGDEMTRILWKMIKDELILPFIDLKLNIMTLGLNTAMRLMTRLHLSQQKQQRNMVLLLNVQLLHQMLQEWMSII